MKNCNIILPLLCVLLTCLSCKKEPEEDMDPVSLVGSWKIASAVERESNDTLKVTNFTVNFNTAECLTLFSTCNVLAADYSINGKQVTLHPKKELNRCTSQAEMAVINGLAGRYEVGRDTFKVVTENLELTFHRTSQTDPYQCDLSTLLIDSIETERYYSEEIFDMSTQRIYGKWFMYQASGGWAGGELLPDYDFLEIKKNGIYGLIKENEILEYGKIVIDQQNDEFMIIDLLPDENSNWLYTPNDNVQKRVELADSLVIMDMCIHCYKRYFFKFDTD